MKLTKILIIEIIEFLVIIHSDHVQVIRCAEQQKCLRNLDQHLLEIIKLNLVNGTEPCENFWDYACGSWTAAPSYDHVDNFGIMANYYADNLITTLKEIHTKKSNEYQSINLLVDQLMKYFMSCKITESYFLNMAPYLNEIPFGEIFDTNFKWSQVFEDSEHIWETFNWLKSVAFLRKYGFKNIFLQESVEFAWNNSLQYVLHWSIPHVSTHFESKYKVLHVMEEFDLIFSNNTRNHIKIAQNIVEFDKELQNLYKKYQLTKQYHFMTLQDFQQLISNIDLSLYYELLLNQKIPPETSIEFLGNLNYFHDLDLLLKQKSKRIVGSYILMRFCLYLLYIRPLITDRECLLHTNVMFPLGINFIHKQFIYKNRLKDEQILQNIFNQLKQEFALILKENKFFLSFAERQYLQKKFEKMQIRIGNLPLYISNINHSYSSVRLIANNFYHNHLEMLKFRTYQQYQRLLSPVNLTTYYINDDISQLRNAPYFIHQRNQLIVPMLFLQLPFYHYSQHPIFQYSLVGWIIAHELSHAFDARGLQFDAWGNENVMGLQLSRKPVLQTTVECLTRHSPTISVNERMADVNGLQLAWQTFKHYVHTSVELDEQLSLNEIFFINFAQFFCGSLPPAIDHDWDDVRVRQTVANMREFSKVFQCPVGAKENPMEKCNIWRK